MTRITTLFCALAVVVAACGDSGTATTAPAGALPSDAFAFAASSDLAVGSERLLVAVSDEQGTRLASPEIAVTISVWPEEAPAEVSTGPGRFLWAIEGTSGLYRIEVEFDRAGIWAVQVTPDAGPALDPFVVSVRGESLTVGVGEPAPRSETLTLEDGRLDEITSATEPDPDFYRLSVAEAVTSGRPTVIVFATPRFCATAICAPTLDRVVEIAQEHPGVNFVHVEVFDLSDLENLTPVDAVIEWGLPTEPWIFVVDADGIVVARFEGVVTAEEIERAVGG